MKLEQLLQEMVDAKASDVFIIAGLPLAYSVSGRQVRLDSAPFKPADTEAFVGAIYEASGRNMDTFMQNGNHDDDFSFAPVSYTHLDVYKRQLAMLHGLVDRFLVGLADHLIGGSGLGFRTVLLTFVACERQDRCV